MGLSGVSTWGSDIGGFFALFENQLTPGAARALDPGGRGVRGDAHRGQRHRHPREGAAAGVGRLRAAAVAALGRSCAPSSTPTSPRPTPSTAAPGCRSCATWRSPIPTTRRRPAWRTSSSSGPTCWPRRCSTPGPRRARAPSPRARGWTCGARPASATPTAGSRSAARGVLDGGRDVTLPAPLSELPAAGPGGNAAHAAAPRRGHAGRLRGRRSRGVAGRAARPPRAAGLPPRRRRRRAWRTAAACARGRDGDRGGSTSTPRRRRTWDLQASLGTLRHPFTPCSVRLDGRRLSHRSWSYDADTGVLRAHLPAGTRWLSADRWSGYSPRC